MSPRRHPQAYRAEAALIAVGMVWGGTFPVVKIAIQSVGALWFNAYRFLIAGALALAILLGHDEGRKNLRALAPHAALLGTLLALGYTFQTVGIAFTTSGKAGFITGLFVVFVPLISALFFQHRPSRVALVSVGLAVVGLALLSLNTDWTVNKGDGLVLLCAIAYAVHILFLDRATDRFDSVSLAMGQVFVAGVEMALLAFLIQPSVPRPTPYTLWSVVLTAIFGTIIAFFIQTYAQKHIGPTRTALILLTEPVFAAIFGYLLLDEILSGRRLAGAAILLTAMVLAELFGRQKVAPGVDD
jgi:drug/metabolite transporter (DMT)-like permease